MQKLAAGVKIRVKGEVQGDVVKPVSIEFLVGDDAASPMAVEPVDPVRPASPSVSLATKENSFSIEGSIAQVDLVNKTLRLNGNTFNLPAQLAGTDMLEALKNGTSVSLQGTVQDGQVVATKLVVGKN